MTKKPQEMIADLNANVQKSMEEYVELGAKVQDEMFKMAHQQMEAYRSFTEQSLKQQESFFNQFETNAKRTRELWLKGLESWQTSLQNLQPKK